MRTRPWTLLLLLVPALCRPASREERTQTWRAEASLGQTRFNVGGVSGSYQRFTPQLSFKGWAPWTAGGSLPLIRLNAGGRHHWGLGASELFGEYRVPGTAWSAVDLGARLSLPGNETAGMADHRVSLTPYASYQWRREALRLSSRVGYRHYFGDDDGKHSVLVDPHATSELLYRLGAGWKKDDSSVDTEFYVDGQNGRARDQRGPGFLKGGIALLFPVDEDRDLRFTAEHALTHPRRFENALALSFVERW
jgi:hypothetical protein